MTDTQRLARVLAEVIEEIADEMPVHQGDTDVAGAARRMRMLDAVMARHGLRVEDVRRLR